MVDSEECMGTVGSEGSLAMATSSASGGEMLPELKTSNFSNKMFEDGLMSAVGMSPIGMASARGMSLMAATQFKSEHAHHAHHAHASVLHLPPTAFGYHPAHYDGSALASLHGHAPLAYHSRDQAAFSHA